VDKSRIREIVEEVKEVNSIIEAALGITGDSMLRNMAIMAFVAEKLKEASPLPPGPPLPPIMRIRERVGCPYLKDLTCYGSEVSETWDWGGTCSVTNKPCADIKLGLIRHYECVTYYARKWVEFKDGSDDRN